MFRENVLTQDDILDHIASTMVAVAVDREKATGPRTAEGRFLVPLMKKNPEPGSPCIFSPDGKHLGGFRGYDFPRVKPFIEDCLKSFGPVQPRQVKAAETHPHRGKGVLAGGGVCLALYVRPARETAQSLHTRSPVISSVPLTAAEFRAFTPGEAAVGSKWTLPEPVARRLSRISSPLCYQHAPQPDWVTGIRIDAEVEAVRDGAAWVKYQGHIASSHRVGRQTISEQEVKLTGTGVYDVSTQKMRSLLLVGSGTLRWPEDSAKRVTFEALVEWNLEAADPTSAR